eukprot:2100339-Prymnesium_polylepis.1
MASSEVPKRKWLLHTDGTRTHTSHSTWPRQCGLRLHTALQVLHGAPSAREIHTHTVGASQPFYRKACL